MENAKYALWLLCILSFGFIFILPGLHGSKSDQGNVRRCGERSRRIERFVLPQIPGNPDGLQKFINNMNVTAIMENAKNSISNITNAIGNMTNGLMQKAKNYRSSIKVEIVKGRNGENGKALEGLRRKIKSLCSNFTMENGNVSKCLDSLSKMGGNLVTGFNGTNFHVLLNVTLEETSEAVGFRITFRDSQKQNLTGIFSGLGNLFKEHFKNLGNGFQLPRLDAPFKRTNPSASKLDWNVIDGNKHLEKPIVVSTFTPIPKKSKDGKKKSGGVKKKSGNDNDNVVDDNLLKGTKGMSGKD